MPPRWIKGRLQKDRYGGAEDANALPEANASIANDTSKPESVARESLSSDHAQTIDHHRRQPAAKRLKQDDQDDNQAEAPSEQSTNADADNASRQRASGSSDDAWYSGSEEDSDSDGDSPAGFVQCGYLQSTTDPSDIIHLRMNLRKGEFQLLRLGKADDCEIYLEGPEFHQLYHRADAVQNDPGANSTVARVRRGHDGMVCVVKTIAADRAGMGVKEVSAYADLGKHSNIVRMLEWFHDETFYDYRGSSSGRLGDPMLNVSLNLP
ncbi:hypothetical protein FRC00_002324 [Tulasnella sp. 408]|nr:hypothetical protein FRC00_002324 [Tulasnella sp. 408]